MAAIFDEVRFPLSIAVGPTGGPEFSTDIVTVSGGDESRNQNWTAARWTGEVTSGIKKKADTDALILFFRARKGKARGFRLRDWSDYRATAQTLSPGTAFKKSSSDVTAAASDHSYTTAGAVNYSALLPGDSIYVTGFANGGNNGTKTVVSATATKIIVTQAVTVEAAGAAVTILKLGPYQLQKTYTDAGNSDVRTIKKPVSGTVVVYFASVAQPTWWTIDLTTGIVTLVAGTANPADAAAITADFQFDIPVRFDTDKAQFVAVDIGDADGPYFNWQKIPLVEVRV